MGNLNLSDGNKCPICGELNCSIWVKDIHDPFYYYDCKKCGGFFVPDAHRTIYDYEGVKNKFNLQHLQSYLFYHKSHLRPVICEKEYFDKHITDEFVQIYNITPEMVESWYPKNFAEKIDLILSQLHSQTEYIGQSKTYNYIDLKDVFFVYAPTHTQSDVIEKKYSEQMDYYIMYLRDNEYICWSSSGYAGSLTWGHKSTIKLTPKGLARVEELQKNQKNNKNVFVAMKFGEETKELREKIKEGLKGFSVRIMDEIEHNQQIVPEMLYEIRNSRFVVAELSHHNNGAYYEAGYALGLGKEVIHICDKKELKSGLHFDVAQVNTIFYDSIDEIPEKLRRRIEATIK